MNTFTVTPLTDREREYWRKRWAYCAQYGYTYPPEIRTERPVYKTVGWWIFKRTYIVGFPATCLLCGERIETGHYCKALQSGNL